MKEFIFEPKDPSRSIHYFEGVKMLNNMKNKSESWSTPQIINPTIEPEEDMGNKDSGIGSDCQ